MVTSHPPHPTPKKKSQLRGKKKLSVLIICVFGMTFYLSYFYPKVKSLPFQNFGCYHAI